MSEESQRIDNLPRVLVPRVLSLVGPYAGPNLYRVWWPNGYLATKGFVTDYVDYKSFDEQINFLQSGRYNMVVSPRIAFSTERGYTDFRDVLKRMNVAWVYDSDDDLWSPEFPDRQAEVFKDLPELLPRQRYETERLQRIYVLERVDGVTVTTPYLAETAKRFTPSTVQVVPNAINVAAFEFEASRGGRVVDPLTVGWSGTRRVDDDLTEVAQAWSIIAARFPEVKFVVHGYESPALLASVPAHRLTILPFVSVHEYPLALKNIDIMCCAVSHDVWNLNKSPCKWFEATLAGSACVVSQVLYGSYIQHLKTGLVANNVGEWVDGIQVLINDAQMRKRVQRNAYDAVLAGHSLDAVWPHWILAWADVLDERRKLRGYAAHPRPEFAAARHV